MSFVLSILGCSPDIPAPPPETSTEETSVPSTPYVPREPPAGAAPLLRVEVGYSWDTPLFADVNGDGAIDATTRVWREESVYDGLVFGPLDDLQLPRDFSVLFDYSGWYPSVLAVGEYTGAPPADVLFVAPGYGTYAIPGPWDGSSTVDPSWIPFAGDWSQSIDANGDGVLDFVYTASAVPETPPPETLAITFGPVERFAGPPDVTMPLCRVGGYRDDGPEEMLHLVGDVDGDGTPEVSVPPFGAYYGADCGGFTVSLPESGAVDPFSGSAGPVDGVATSATTVGDWSGDGLPDLLSAAAPDDWSGWFGPPGAVFGVLLSPFTFDPFDLGPAEAVPFPEGVLRAASLPFDRNGDGRRELGLAVNWDGDRYGLAVVDSTLDALAAPLAPIDGLGPESPAYVEDGRAKVVFTNAVGAWAVDVGPAAPL